MATVGRILAVVMALGAVLAAASAARAQGGASSPDAQAKKLMQYGDNVAKAQGAGEQFGWAVNYSAGDYLSGYLRTKDTAWLDASQKIMDYCVGKMRTGPDGYKGFIGDFIYNGREGTKYCTDVHVGDAILIAHMLNFAEVVLKDPELKKKYAEAAQKYVEIAKRDLIEKWDKRGTWKEDGPYGCYVGWDMFCTAADPNTWKEDPKILLAEPAEPFNKNNDMGLCALRIYRITGEEKYRDRAMKVFSYQKSRLQYVEEANFSYYVWNYWDPFGPESVDLEKKDTRHWMNVHGDRPYNAGEVGQIVEAYNSGVVFDKTDIERLLNTNLKVMWNGDMDKPRFGLANWKLPMPAGGKPMGPEANAPGAVLWTGLMQFSQTIRDLAGGRGRGASEKAPTFDRLWCAEKDAKVFDFPFHSCKSLTAAAVMPSIVKRGTKAIIMCKARVPQSTFEVALYSADGKEKVQTIHEGKIDGGLDGHAGIFLLQWDPASVAQSKPIKGPFRIRWTGVDGYREFPITVAE